MTPLFFELLELNQRKIKEKDPSKEVLSYMKTTKIQFNFIADVILSNTHYKNNPSLSVSWHFKKMIRKLKIEQRYPKNHLNLIEWSKPWCFLFNSQISQQLTEKPWGV